MQIIMLMMEAYYIPKLYRFHGLEFAIITRVFDFLIILCFQSCVYFLGMFFIREHNLVEVIRTRAYERLCSPKTDTKGF